MSRGREAGIEGSQFLYGGGDDHVDVGVLGGGVKR